MTHISANTAHRHFRPEFYELLSDNDVFDHGKFEAHSWILGSGTVVEASSSARTRTFGRSSITSWTRFFGNMYHLFHPFFRKALYMYIYNHIMSGTRTFARPSITSWTRTFERSCFTSGTHNFGRPYIAWWARSFGWSSTTSWTRIC